MFSKIHLLDKFVNNNIKRLLMCDNDKICRCLMNINYITDNLSDSNKKMIYIMKDDYRLCFLNKEKNLQMKFTKK